jgi:hypothetical protein
MVTELIAAAKDATVKLHGVVRDLQKAADQPDYESMRAAILAMLEGQR